MTLPREGRLLRIFIGESDRHENLPLHEWLVRKARENGLAGATVLRGLEGFGANSRLHTAKILRLSSDLPIVVEIVDTTEKIEAFMALVDEAVREGLATLEPVEVRLYRGGEKKEGAPPALAGMGRRRGAARRRRCVARRSAPRSGRGFQPRSSRRRCAGTRGLAGLRRER